MIACDHRLESTRWPNITAPSMIVFGQLLGLGFDHQHAFGRAGDDEVERGSARISSIVRVQHVLAVDIADAGGGDRAHERQAGDGQRRRGADHGHDVGIVLQIVAQHGADDLGLVAEALGEQRPDRPVDQARGQHLLLAGPAFALEEAARDLAGGEGLLLVVDGEREEIDVPASIASWPRRRCRARWCRHRWPTTAPSAWRATLPVSRMRLAAAPIDFLAMNSEHRRVVLSGNGRKGCAGPAKEAAAARIPRAASCVGPADLRSRRPGRDRSSVRKQDEVARAGRTRAFSCSVGPG